MATAISSRRSTPLGRSSRERMTHSIAS
jgi:hypothetical protein